MALATWWSARALARGARHAGWALAGRRALASSSNRAADRPSGPPSPIDAVVRGGDDLDRAELITGASHSLDRALIEQVLHSDDQEVAAREWLHEAESGQLEPDFERYLDWEDAQLARVRALRAGLVEPPGPAAAPGDGAAAEGEGEQASAEGEGAEAADAEGEGEGEGGAPGAPDGRLLPRVATEHLNDFPGELRRDELNSAADRAQLEQTAAVHAAEGMPFELAEISHRQKEALYALHAADPVTYSAERVGAMLCFPPDHVRAIFFLQQQQASSEAEAAQAEGDDEEAAQAKARARQLASELAELATEYDRQFDPFLSREQIAAHLRFGARAMRNPSLGSAALAERVYARQRLEPSSGAQLEAADRSSAALERFVEFEERAFHFARTSPAALEALAARAAAAAPSPLAPERSRPHALAEPEAPSGRGQPAYRSRVLAQLRKLDAYAAAEANAFEAVSRAHEAKAGGGAAGPSGAVAEAEQLARAAEARAGADEAAPFEHPGLSEPELVELLGADAARARLPELLCPQVAQLLFDAQYFAAEFDLPAAQLHAARQAEAHAREQAEPGEAAGATGAKGAGFVTLPASVAPFTTLVPTGRTTPRFRFVADLGPDANYLTKREQETIARRAARAQDGARAGFDPAAAAARIARNRQRRFQQKRPGEFVVVDTTAEEGALRGSRARPVGRVVVHERGASRPGTAEEHAEAKRYLGHGAQRPNRLRFAS